MNETLLQGVHRPERLSAGRVEAAVPRPPRGRAGPRPIPRRCRTTCSSSATRRPSRIASSTSSTCSTPSAASTSTRPDGVRPLRPERRRGRDRRAGPPAAGDLLRRAQPGRPGHPAQRRPPDPAARAVLDRKLKTDGPTAPVVTTVLAEEATKARLGRLLGGEETPALAVHRQPRHGLPQRRPAPAAAPGGPAVPGLARPAPVAQDEPIPADFYFAGDDVVRRRHAARADRVPLRLLRRGHAQARRLRPMPRRRRGRDRAPRLRGRPAAAAAAHPQGGALAVVGHVERAWGYSFIWRGPASSWPPSRAPCCG